MTQEQYCTIYLVRHGETKFNVGKKIQGQSDSPLTEEGKKQSLKLAQSFGKIKFAAIFSSDLGRAVKSAEIIRLNRLLAVNTSKALRERAYGIYDGRPLKKYVSDVQKVLKKIEKFSEFERRKYRIHKSIESENQLMARFNAKLREIAVAFPGKNVLVVSHGTAIRTFLIHAGAMAREKIPGGSLKNSAYVKLRTDGIDFFVEKIVGYKKPGNII